MRLRGYPTNGSPAVSYVGTPSGSIIGSADLPVGRLIQVPGIPGPPGGTPGGGGSGSGDMLASVYDPNSVEDDAFDQDNMVSGTTNKNFTATEKTKLAGVATAATANATNAQLRDRSTHTGTQSADSITDGSTNKVLSAANKTKLDGIATGATANSTDAALRDRSTHTGSQPSTSISDFTEAVQDAVAALLAQGTNVTLTYNDAGNTLTVEAAGGSGGADAELIRDTIGVALVGAGAISVGVNDAANTITLSTTATANSTDAVLLSRSNHTGTQSISTVTGTKAQFNTAVTDGDIVYTDNAALTDTRTPTAGSVTTASFNPAALVTASETIGANNNNTTVPTSAAVKAYADSAGSSPARLHKFPDMHVEDLATLIGGPGGTLTTTNVAGGTTTTIASGVARAALSNPSGLAASNLGPITLIGTTASELVAISGSYYAANWKVASTGTSGVVTYPTAPWGVEFFVSNSRYVEFQIAVASGGTTPYRIWIDDRPMTSVPVVPAWSGGAGATLKIDLGTGVGTDRSTHKIRFMSHMLAIANIWTEPAGVIHPAGKTDLNVWPRLMVVGDSLTEGFTYNTGLSMGTWLPRFANICGIRDFWNAAIAGTSFNLANGSYTNYKSRATTDVLPFSPDIVIAGTWFNDKSAGRTAAQIAADVGTTIDNLNAGSNDPLIIILGAPDPLGVNGSDFTTIDTSVKTVAASKGAALILPSTGEVVSSAGTSLMTDGPWFTTTNKSGFIGADNLHPTDAGHRYMAYRMREAFEAILRAQ